MKYGHAILFLGGVLVGALIALLITLPMGRAQAPASPALATGTHAHPLIPVDPGLPIPRVILEAWPDAVSGVNLHLITTDFTFTPELANTAPRPNQGHADVFVNGSKVGRVYGAWHHLDAGLLADGANLIEVTLNANNHAEWTSGGRHIAASVTLTR